MTPAQKMTKINPSPCPDHPTAKQAPPDPKPLLLLGARAEDVRKPCVRDEHTHGKQDPTGRRTLTSSEYFAKLALAHKWKGSL